MSESEPRDASRIPSLKAFLFDLDGVLTPTVEVHMRAWSRLFTPFLEAREASPYTDTDYFESVDGRPRYDGVRTLLASRGIELPDGTPDDGPDDLTVCGLGNRKNAEFTAELAEHGIAPYPGSLAFLDRVDAAGMRTAVVTSSKNGASVLETAGIAARVEALVDGVVAAEEKLPGKPHPDTYLDAARRLGLDAADCIVVEDAISGVEAGRAGRFGLVIGVDRGVGADALAEHGADIVVDDLADLLPALPQADPEATTDWSTR